MTGPLADVVVLDLTRALAGPHATMMLGDLGARVIKVEQPGTGDESRQWGPPFVGPAADPIGTYFLSCNRNKESITLDLKTPEGAELLTRLVRRVDVLAENFRPGVLDRLGFSCDRLLELNPRLVILSITGFGHDGPEGGRPGYDQIAQGEAGLMGITGPSPDQPTKSGVPIADLLAGVHGAYGVLAALYERTRTGAGKVVRTSLLAGVVATHAFQGTRYTVAGEVPRPAGNHHPSISPYGAYRCSDGLVQVGVANETQWRRFAPIAGVDPDEPRFAGNVARVRHRTELTEAIEATLTTRPRAYWLPRFAAAGVPAGAIRSMDEVYGWEQTRSQGLVVTVDHPVLGEIELPGPAVRFDGDPPGDHRPPPRLGEHDEAVRAWLEETTA